MSYGKKSRKGYDRSKKSSAKGSKPRGRSHARAGVGLSTHAPLRKGCPECGCLSATIAYYRGTNVVQGVFCDGCGADLS